MTSINRALPGALCCLVFFLTGPAAQADSLPQRGSLGSTDPAIGKVSYASAALAISPPAAASVGPMQHIVQTLNNCGPASVAEVLNHWGVQKTQADLTF